MLCDSAVADLWLVTMSYSTINSTTCLPTGSTVTTEIVSAGHTAQLYVRHENLHKKAHPSEID